MKLRFLCGNHRHWLNGNPEQAIRWCADSFENGCDLAVQGRWQEALPHMGCAFETAEILLTNGGISPARGVAWFIDTLGGLTRTLVHLERIGDCMEMYQAAIDRLRRQAAMTVSPELESQIYRQITRLNRERRKLGPHEVLPVPQRQLAGGGAGARVLH